MSNFLLLRSPSNVIYNYYRLYASSSHSKNCVIPVLHACMYVCMNAGLVDPVISRDKFMGDLSSADDACRSYYDDKKIEISFI